MPGLTTTKSSPPWPIKERSAPSPDDRLAVLFLLSSLCLGGSEKKTIRLANALHQQGVDAHLAYLNGPETLLAAVDPDVPLLHLGRRGKFSWAAARRLRDYVTTHGISHLVAVNLYPLLYLSALGLLMGRAARPASLVAVNTTDFLTRKEAAQMMLYAPLLRRSDRIVFGCDHQLRYWQERYRLPGAKCRQIYNGVDEEHFVPTAEPASSAPLRRALGLGADDFVIATVGQLRPEKQQQDLIEAIARLRKAGVRAKALIAGSGPAEAVLRRLIAACKLDGHVQLLGRMRDVRPLLGAADVFALTSVAVETFSNAALEAMAMGRPLVISDIGGAREMVREGVNGHLFAKGDVEALTAILAALAAAPARLRQMGAAARRIAVQQFSFTRMTDAYQDILRSIRA